MAEPVTAPDMRIRVGTGSHRCRHSDVRCARGRRANRPFVPLPANARRGAAVHRAGRVARAAGVCRSARSGTTSSCLRLYKSKIQFKISCAFSPNEPNFALMIPDTWVQPTRSSPSSRASVLTPRLMLPSPLSTDDGIVGRMAPRAPLLGSRHFDALRRGACRSTVSRARRGDPHVVLQLRHVLLGRRLLREGRPADQAGAPGRQPAPPSVQRP